MPSAAEIQRYLTGAWRLMTGKPDGLLLLDISVDGFWNSFFAIVIALPALFVSWIGVANEIAEEPLAGGRLSILLRLAAIDLSAWILPLVALAVAAPLAGIGARFVHYVVASNWGSALIIWLMLPAAMLRLISPSSSDLASLLSIGLFGLSMVLTWRLTNVVIGRGPTIGTAVFAGMFIASLAVLFLLQAALGIQLPG
ncbi:transporter [Allomesorhizobium camelthorni]|uniref:Transporter n=1 Tax=Allomesorhizobium camelthorni TaxID=475069 RepID=A0A6G4WE09_9HYPH|nr:transporter [Mesorhizobium camelthorni]NGO53045.1 transporter [Mesorhizobium camelthorni]